MRTLGQNLPSACDRRSSFKSPCVGIMVRSVAMEGKQSDKQMCAVDGCWVMDEAGTLQPGQPGWRSMIEDGHVEVTQIDPEYH